MPIVDASALGCSSGVQRRDVFRRSPRRRGAAATTSRSSAATSASPTAELAERVNRFGRALRDDSASGRKSASPCCCSTGPPSPTASSARSRPAPCRCRSTRCGADRLRARAARLARAGRRSSAPRSLPQARRPSARGHAAASTTSWSSATPAATPRLRRVSSWTDLVSGARPSRHRSDDRDVRRSGSIRRAAPAAEGLRAPAARHGGVRGAVRARACSASRAPIAASASPSCSSPTAWATRCTCRSRWARTTILWPGPPTRRARLRDDRARTGRRCSSRCRPATACCSRSDGRRVDLVVASGCAVVGRRSAAARALRALQAALRRRHPRRHRLHRGAAHVHLQPARRASARARAGSSCPATRRASSTTTARRCRRARLATSGSAATRRARATGTSTRRPRTPSKATGSAPATSTRATPTATTGTPGRIDDMLKVGGMWVSPVEVENALIEHAAVLECGVVGREDRDGLIKPAAFVVLRDGQSTARRSWRPRCSTSCGSGSPTTSGRAGSSSCPSCRRPPTGKIQRFKLRDRRARSERTRGSSSPPTSARCSTPLAPRRLPAMAGVPHRAHHRLRRHRQSAARRGHPDRDERVGSAARSAFAPVVSLGYRGNDGGRRAGRPRRRSIRAPARAARQHGSLRRDDAGDRRRCTDIATLAALRFLAGIGLGGALPNAATLAAEFVPPRATADGGDRDDRLRAARRDAGRYPAAASCCRRLAGARCSSPAASLPLVAALALARLLPESPRFLARHPARWPELARLAPDARSPVPAGRGVRRFRDGSRERARRSSSLFAARAPARHDRAVGAPSAAACSPSTSASAGCRRCWPRAGFVPASRAPASPPSTSAASSARWRAAR